jgi:hypothetical protein
VRALLERSGEFFDRDRHRTEARHGGGTKFTKFTRNTKKPFGFVIDFVIFVVLVIFVAAAVGRVS